MDRLISDAHRDIASARAALATDADALARDYAALAQSYAGGPAVASRIAPDNLAAAAARIASAAERIDGMEQMLRNFLP